MPPTGSRYTRDDVFLQLSSIAFDASTFEIWGPLTNGGRLAIYPLIPIVPEYIADVVRAEKVTILWLTTGLFHLMVDSELALFSEVQHVLIKWRCYFPPTGRASLQATSTSHIHTRLWANRKYHLYNLLDN